MRCAAHTSLIALGLRVVLRGLHAEQLGILMNQGIFSHGFQHGIAVTVFRPHTPAVRVVLLALSASLSWSCGRWRDSSPKTDNGSRPAAGGSGATVSSSGAAGDDGPDTAGASSSAAGGPLSLGGASGAGPRECGALIDDLEDGSGRICSGS